MTTATHRGAAHSLFLVGFLISSPAVAEWVVNDQGQCVNVWTPESLLRGPKAMLDAPLVPIRFFLGGAVEAAACPDAKCGTLKKGFLGAAGIMIGTVFGTFHGLADAVGGLTDLLSGGTLEWTADDPTRFTLHPIRFVMLGDVCCFFGRPVEWWKDRCGRVIWSPPASLQSPTWFSRDCARLDVDPQRLQCSQLP